MADLNHAVLLRAQANQFVCLRGARGNRLLDEYISIVLERVPANVQVAARGYRDDDGIHIDQQVLEFGVGACFELTGNLVSPLGIDVVNTEQPNVRHFLFSSHLNITQAIEELRSQGEPIDEVERLSAFIEASERGVTV